MCFPSNTEMIPFFTTNRQLQDTVGLIISLLNFVVKHPCLVPYQEKNAVSANLKQSIDHTSIKRQLSVQSTAVAKYCMYIMFHYTAFSCWRDLILLIISSWIFQRKRIIIVCLKSEMRILRFYLVGQMYNCIPFRHPVGFKRVLETVQDFCDCTVGWMTEVIKKEQSFTT